MSELYIGLMSGTSADGIDAALVDFQPSKPTLIATHYTPYTQAQRTQILSLCQPGENEIERLGELDILLGKLFSQAANDLIQSQSLSPDNIKAIGSHGQTIRHHPNSPHRFTLQIGDPNTIAAQTGITTVADFRRKDVAHGGQGAPLVPAFHHYLFGNSPNDLAVVNIGGMANVTLIPKQTVHPITGFDTGPGNVLMDAWMHTHHQQPHDKGGNWGAQGTVHTPLLTLLLSDPYFTTPPPKSTGREHFNLNWLNQQLSKINQPISPADVQATLTELTAQSIITTIKQHLKKGEILICGGGAHNTLLMSRLTELAKPEFIVNSTEQYGVHPDWVEAIAFAWLAKQTLNRRPGNLPSVTGATQLAVLGGVYYA